MTPLPAAAAWFRIRSVAFWALDAAAMIKRESGYDPAHGDWEYRYDRRWPEADKGVVWGKLASCIDCHARGTDYLFRPYLAPARQ